MSRGHWFIDKGCCKTIENEAKERKGRFFCLLLGTLGARLLGNLLTVKGVIRTGEGTIRADEGTIRGSQSF